MLWINRRLYELFVDAPARKVLIIGKEHMVEVNTTNNMLLVDDFAVCKLKNTPQKVSAASESFEVAFQQLPRNIVISGYMCKLDFSGKFPVVIIESKAHGIQFDGPPRKIWTNGVAFMVHMDNPRKCNLPRKARGPMKALLVAFGGPGHEVIVDVQWYAVKFNGQNQIINLRCKKMTIRVEGPTPKVKILSEVARSHQAPWSHPQKCRTAQTRTGRTRASITWQTGAYPTNVALQARVPGIREQWRSYRTYRVSTLLFIPNKTQTARNHTT